MYYTVVPKTTPLEDPEPQRVTFIKSPYELDALVFTMTQAAHILDVPPATLRGWVSRGQFPPKDGEMHGKAPYWYLRTILEYLRNAPGGRLGYPVGGEPWR